MRFPCNAVRTGFSGRNGPFAWVDSIIGEPKPTDLIVFTLLSVNICYQRWLYWMVVGALTDFPPGLAMFNMVSLGQDVNYQ